jgi:hypothetical protein
MRRNFRDSSPRKANGNILCARHALGQRFTPVDWISHERDLIRIPICSRSRLRFGMGDLVT